MKINVTATKVFSLNAEAYAKNPRVIANKGGTRSGKTYSVMQFLILLAIYKHNLHIDVVSESGPHLKRGAIRDFEEILDSFELIDGTDYQHNHTQRSYDFPSGCTVQFFSANDWGKVKGSRRDILFINECNRLAWEVYRQLAVRTTKMIFLDWNPDAEYWYEEHLQNRSNTIEIHSTYKDNDFLSAEQIAEIEANKDDPEWWQVYGLGLTGKPQGLIFPSWEQIDEVPVHARLIGRGLDFGFVNDPTALVAVWWADGHLILDEELYDKNLTNPEIANRLQGKRGMIIADSAEMKSIAEIKNLGIKHIQPSTKGKDSVKNGIDVMKRYKIQVTSRSLNMIYEQRNYKWMQDKVTGAFLNTPVDKFNHLMDAARYCITNLLSAKPRVTGAVASNTEY